MVAGFAVLARCFFNFALDIQGDAVDMIETPLEFCVGGWGLEHAVATIVLEESVPSRLQLTRGLAGVGAVVTEKQIS